ncbi:hypothetical protein IG631_16679 [Alternaria alternata]|nr:hypothetical protein IG631_16679 [Alternaria alternata]
MDSEAAAAGEQNFGASQMSDGEETLTPLEQEVLDEYARLLGNLNTVRLCLFHRLKMLSRVSGFL